MRSLMIVSAFADADLRRDVAAGALSEARIPPPRGTPRRDPPRLDRARSVERAPQRRPLAAPGSGGAGAAARPRRRLLRRRACRDTAGARDAGGSRARSARDARPSPAHPFQDPGLPGAAPGATHRPDHRAFAESARRHRARARHRLLQAAPRPVRHRHRLLGNGSFDPRRGARPRRVGRPRASRLRHPARRPPGRVETRDRRPQPLLPRGRAPRPHRLAGRRRAPGAAAGGSP